MGFESGLHPIGDYSVGTNEDKVQALIALLPNPDVRGHGFKPTNTYLDELMPGALAQLRVELTSLAASVQAGADNGETLPVFNSAGADSHDGTVTVVGEDITKLTLASTVAMVDDGDTISGYVLGVAAGALASVDHSQVWADGTHNVSGGEASGNAFTINTGITTVIALSRLVISIVRAGVNVVADAVITDNHDGTFTVGDGSTYNTTAADVVTWMAKK